MKQTTEELKQIIAGAPESATHYDTGVYFKALNNKGLIGSIVLFWGEDNHRWESVGDMYVSDLMHIRSLADIERIAELEANQAKRDLEQQAKGIEDWLESRSKLMYTASAASIVSAVEYHAGDRIKELRKQAQELGR